MVPAAYSGNVHHHHQLQALLHGKSATVKEEGGRSGRIKSNYNDFQQKIKQNASAPVSAEPRERRPVVIAAEKGEDEAYAV